MAKIAIVISLGGLDSFHPEWGRYQRPGFNWNELDRYAAIQDLQWRLHGWFPEFDIRVVLPRDTPTETEISFGEVAQLPKRTRSLLHKEIKEMIHRSFSHVEELERELLIDGIRRMKEQG